jgi:hypothetical protein
MGAMVMPYCSTISLVRQATLSATMATFGNYSLPIWIAA